MGKTTTSPADLKRIMDDGAFLLEQVLARLKKPSRDHSGYPRQIGGA